MKIPAKQLHAEQLNVQQLSVEQLHAEQLNVQQLSVEQLHAKLSQLCAECSTQPCSINNSSMQNSSA